MSEEEKKPLRIAVVGGSGLRAGLAARLATLAIDRGIPVELVSEEELIEAEKKNQAVPVMLDAPSVSLYNLPVVDVEPTTEDPTGGESRYRRGRRWWEQSKWERGR